MVDIDEEVATATSRKKESMKRTSEWIFSHELPSDITVQVGEATFSLHKFALLSKCEYIKKLVSESNYLNSSIIEIQDIPGGSEAFELVAKFCYKINFEISTENIAMLHCASEYLGMTEEFSVGNLVKKTNEYLEEVALMSLSSAITVLHRSEELLPISDKVKLVSRCIDAISYQACNDSQFYLSQKFDNSSNSQESSSLPSNSQPRGVVDWWAEELMVLRIDTFQRVLMALKARGIEQYALGPIIMLYAQKSLRGLDIFGSGRKKIELKQEHEKRVIVETIVSLLPRERNAMSVSFLSMLLRAALYLESTVACRLDLKKRISLQLEHAVLDDLLIPSFSYNGGSVYDVDTVQRILKSYLDCEGEGSQFDEGRVSLPLVSMEKVGKLMENYLAEIASDQSLAISSFIGLAELIPEQARITEDGIYRAIDIYLKAHPSLSDAERKKICSLMDCQKLSREACAHAAQNDRLPVQTVVQVLYYEQQRLRDSTSENFAVRDSPAVTHKTTSYGTGYSIPMDELTRLRRENDDLKLQLVRMRMQLKELQKTSESSAPPDRPPLPKKSIMNSVSKKLSRLNLFVRADSVKPFTGKVRTKPPKDRRHSIS